MTDSSFRQRVLQYVAQIPAGKVATYGQIAALAGQPRAARQVGGILRALKDPEQVPWQRVLNAQGRISTWRVGLGELQLALLQAEGIVFELTQQCDLSIYLWQPIFQAEQSQPPRKTGGNLLRSKNRH